MLRNLHNWRCQLPWILLLALGCDASNGRYPVSGEVSFNGELVDQGAIVFMPVEGESFKAGGRIESGHYTIPAEKGPVAGKHKVLLYWEKKTGKTYVDRDSGDTYDRRDEGLPKIYQSESTPLSVEIMSGTNVHDFNLTSSSE